ncbi:hypothetical protein SESBI_08495 [Sesbania bispinosa]|nr:hypothetical protein SESBI_08495 [Sesbania bispinosa]
MNRTSPPVPPSLCRTKSISKNVKNTHPLTHSFIIKKLSSLLLFVDKYVGAAFERLIHTPPHLKSPSPALIAEPPASFSISIASS